jgi:hypothetical protein
MSSTITIDRATLEQALEALRGNTTNPVIDPEQAASEDQAIAVIEQVLARPVQEPAALQKSGIANSPSDPEICNERSAQACGPVYCGDSGGYCNKCPKQKLIQA